MSNRLIPPPFYYKKIKYFKNKDEVFKKCKECINYTFGKCTMYKDKSLKNAREYFCHGFYFFRR